MLRKSRIVALMFVAGLLLPQVAVQAQDDGEDGMSIPHCFEQFGRSLYGGYRPKQNQRQTRMPQMDRQAQQQQQQQQAQQRTTSRAAEAFDDDDVDDGVAPRASAPQQVAQRPGQPVSKRRVVADPTAATSHAPPLGQNARCAQPVAEAKSAPANDGVPRVARASNPAVDDADLSAPVEESSLPESLVVRGASPSISVETIGPRKFRSASNLRTSWC